MSVVGLYGIFRSTNYAADNGFQVIQLIFCVVFLMIGNLKIMTIVHNADKIWTILKIAHGSFFSSEHCKKNYRKQIRCGERFATTTFPLYVTIFCSTIVLWITMPHILSTYGANEEIQTVKYAFRTNVMNLRYPIPAELYNKLFYVFYALESTMAVLCVYGLITFDLFLIFILKLMSIQYEIVATAFEKLEVTVENDSGK